MESLYKLQANTKQRIEKAISNFKKSPKERITRSYAEVRLESLEKAWDSFVKVHESIVQGVTELNNGDKYFVDEVYENSEEMYTNYKCDLREVVSKFERGVATPASSDKTVKCKNDSIKLPKISIPTFSGNYTQWPTFKDLFVSLIHQNESLAQVEKLHYLKGLLSGEAEQLVWNIPITSANYDECWSILSNRFDNKRFISNCLLKRLMSQPVVVENSISIKGLLDTTMECLNGLKNIGVEIKSWDIIVIHIVSLKLDIESRKQWETKISSHDNLPTLVELREFLEARSRALEFLDSKDSRPRPSLNKPKVHHVVSTDINANVNVTCPYCNEGHKIANCKQFVNQSYESRHDFVQTNRLCFNCLGIGHSIKFCRQSSCCRVCKRRHHSLLHPKSVSNSAVSNAESTSTAEEVKSTVSAVQTALSEDEPYSSSVVSHFSQRSVPTQVLLATALVEAQTGSGSTQLLRVLLDQGSQASFITESTVQLLGLKKTASRTVVSGIGGEESSFASRSTVTVTIHSRFDPNFSVQVEAFVLGTITSLLPSEKLAKFNWPEIQLTLADPEYHTPNKIDVLLGAEVYGQVLREGLNKGPLGFPVAQNTALGWILFGKVPSSSDSNIHCHHSIIRMPNQVDDNALLKQCWKIESTIRGSREILSEDEQQCEDIHSQTTSRDGSGSEHTDIQRGVWRDDPMHETFGTLAAVDESSHCPEISEKPKEGLMLKKKVTEVLTKGSCVLQKWVRSCKKVNEPMKDERDDTKEMDQDQGMKEKDIMMDEIMNILGSTWDRDCNEYSVKRSSQPTPLTKQRAITDIARLLDPLGLAAPCVVTSKIFIQKLWLSGLGRDEELPLELTAESQTYRHHLEETCNFSIPGWVPTSANSYCVELYGFLDVSIARYAAVVYVRVLKADKSIIISLITARTRVVPVQQQHPRLELKRTALLADLIFDVLEVMKITQTHVHAWTNSSVVLVWLSSHPSRWTTFVANRVCAFLSQIVNFHWAHVQSSQNQAYCRKVSRWRNLGDSSRRYETELTKVEIEEATKVCIRQVQEQELNEEIEDLRNRSKVKKKLKSLGPMTDSNEILRANDLSAQGFIAGFRRFVRRKGQVSDTGTNFVGGSKELGHLGVAKKSSATVDIREWLGNNGKTWHFIPPLAPNFGRLWEAGVKSTKFHLKRVIGNLTLAYEEMSTVLIQVDAYLNSRPLSMMPDNPNDPSPLSPGNFLIVEPRITVPDRNYEDSNLSSVKRWQLCQRVLQEFWWRWSEEYFVHLQQRYKWNKLVPEPNIGDIVLVKEDNVPPARWMMGKIIQKHSGLDKVTRVVTLKCNGTLCKQPVSRLCVLPISD